MKIGEVLKDIRIRRGLSQQELALKAGVPQNVVSRLERDLHKPNEVTLKKFSRGLNVDIEALYLLSALYLAESSKKESLKKELAPGLKEEILSIYFNAEE